MLQRVQQRVRGGQRAAVSSLCLAMGAGDGANAEGDDLAAAGLGLRLGFQSIPSGAVQPCMGGGVTLAWDNVSCQESADPSQNKMYLCQDE